MIEVEQDHHVAAVLDQALGLFDHHLGDLHVARRRLVEGRGNDLALHRALHVGDFLGPLVDQEHDQIALGVIGRDGLGDVLQDHRLAGARLGDDERALALAERRHEIDDARGLVLDGRIFDFHLEPLVRIERRQIVEMDLVAHFLRVFEIDRVDLEQGEIALAVLGRADLALDRVAGAQAEAADLGRGDIDVVGAGQVIRLGAAQEAEAVLEHFEHARAGDFDLLLGELL